MDWREGLQNIGIFLQETGIEFIEQQCEEEVFLARERQQDIDVLNATKAFVALDQDDGQIYQLLLKYFGIEDISLAKEYINTARIRSQLSKMHAYCDQEGIDYKEYCDKYFLKKRLESNSELLNMTPNKLNAYLEKHQ